MGMTLEIFALISPIASVRLVNIRVFMYSEGFARKTILSMHFL